PVRPQLVRGGSGAGARDVVPALSRRRRLLRDQVLARAREHSAPRRRAGAGGGLRARGAARLAGESLSGPAARADSPRLAPVRAAFRTPSLAGRTPRGGDLADPDLGDARRRGGAARPRRGGPVAGSVA